MPAGNPPSATLGGAVDLSRVEAIVARLGRESDKVIPILQAIQNEFRYLPAEALTRVCEISEITPARIAGVASFYMQFRHRPVGQHIVSVCHGTACHVKGSALVQEALERHLGLTPDRDTDASGLFTVQHVACLGCCTLAPVVQIDGVTFGHVTPRTVPQVLEEFLHYHKNGTPPATIASHERGRETAEIRIGLGSCCVAQGSAKVHQAVGETLAASGVDAVVKRVGCVGMCHQTPLLEVIPAGGTSRLYSRVSPEEARRIVRRGLKPQGWLGRARSAVADLVDWALPPEETDPRVRRAIDVRDPPVCAFLGPQRHIATDLGGQLDPTDYDEYVRSEGFVALRHAVTDLAPETIIETVRASGLRGRGGAGFRTGEKWAKVRAARGDDKIIVCNGDEGDPGAFMDRMLLESFPYRIIEGMAIAARAVGARRGIFYIRAEYPLAVERIRAALAVCREKGVLGKRVLGSDVALDLEIREGAGAFVCGEETALLESIEGRRGMPRLRPPYPAERGLWGRPTLVNNVETYACVPWILRQGAEAFAALGTATSKGTKVFALAGRVRRGGLIEVPMGTTIRQVVEEIGGGVAGDHAFKAVQIGGPSGGCVPAALADTPIDFEELTRVGAMMGSGGLVVLDDSDCMVDIARYFLDFTEQQSCGKCTFCRIGTKRMLEILERLCAGQAKRADLDELQELADRVRRTSLCGLGRTAPNPVLTTLKYFHDEYEAHLQGRCPAGRCKALITYQVTDRCIGCTRCAQRCPVQAIELRPYQKHEINSAKCVRCGGCKAGCPVGAIEVK
jgi:NADH-quinone oxidoreductase subunit F